MKMPKSNFYLCSDQLIEDLKSLLAFHSIPFPSRTDIFEYEDFIENIQAAIERMSPCPLFDCMAAPGKSHREF